MLLMLLISSLVRVSVISIIITITITKTADDDGEVLINNLGGYFECERENVIAAVKERAGSAYH